LPLSVKAEDLWLKDIPVKKLEELYKDIHYKGDIKDHLMIKDRSYPRIFLKNFPLGYEKITDEQRRNNLFLKILIPLAMRINEDILSLRNKLQKLQQKFIDTNELSQQEIDKIENLASTYDIFTRIKGKDRYAYLLHELLIRVDIVPASILVTAAAIETNWGSSRIVREGNSLYKILQWHTTEGMKPIGETEDDSYRIKTYPDLYSSINDYTLRVNSARSFEKLRNFRRELRALNNSAIGQILAPYTFGSSNLDNYPGLFDYTLAYYELLTIDKAILKKDPPSKNIINKYKKYFLKK
jgi:Bax protein